MKINNNIKSKKEMAIIIIMVILAIFGFSVRMSEVAEKNKSSYDSDWRYHHYSRSYNTGTNADSSANELNSDNSYNHSAGDSNINDDSYGKQYYDDADDFADENAEEFGDGDEDDGWDDAYDYYEEK